MCAIVSAALRMHGCFLGWLVKLFVFGHVAAAVCSNEVFVLELLTSKLIALESE